MSVYESAAAAFPRRPRAGCAPPALEVAAKVRVASTGGDCELRGCRFGHDRERAAEEIREGLHAGIGIGCSKILSSKMSFVEMKKGEFEGGRKKKSANASVQGECHQTLPRR